MRKLIYQFFNPMTGEIIEVHTLAEAQEIRKHEYPYTNFTIENIVLRECNPKLICIGENANGKRLFRYQTFDEATAAR